MTIETTEYTPIQEEGCDNKNATPWLEVGSDDPRRPFLEVFAEAQSGDETAFADLWNRCQRSAVKAAGRIAGAERSEDMAQETAIKVFMKIGELALPADAEYAEYSFKAWVRQIAQNKALDQLRRDASRIRPTSLDQSAETMYPLQNRIPDEAIERPEESVVVRDVLQRAAAAIPQTFRDAVVAIDFHGMSYQEYADLSGIKVGTVRSRLSRGRTVLQQRIRDGKIDGLAHD